VLDFNNTKFSTLYKIPIIAFKTDRPIFFNAKISVPGDSRINKIKMGRVPLF